MHGVSKERKLPPSFSFSFSLRFPAKCFGCYLLLTNIHSRKYRFSLSLGFQGPCAFNADRNLTKIEATLRLRSSLEVDKSTNPDLSPLLELLIADAAVL